MCLAIPARVVELLPALRAIVDLSGVRKDVSIDLVDDAQVGDYVIIHVGYAHRARLDPDEAANAPWRYLPRSTPPQSEAQLMKYIDEFRDGELAQTLAARIARLVEPARDYRFMEFCGGHTHAISRYGLSDLLPANVRMIHGPGCPVCVLPIGRVDLAIHLALQHSVILCTYGDTMRVPASDGLSLIKTKAGVGERRATSAWSTRRRCLQAGRDNPEHEVVFFAIGFETTTPPTALVIRDAATRTTDQLQRAVLPRADATRHHRHSGIA
jgi:hydrogenase assembly chaperone HypC/HupF